VNIKTINDLLSYVETEGKAQRLINYINSLENYVKMKEIDIREFSKENYYNKLEIERLNNIINEIKDYVYKPIDKEWDDILCIIEDGLKDSDKE